MRKLDLTGQKFGRLTAVTVAPNRGARTRWLCQCDCGVETNADTISLRTGNTTSCGCFTRERTTETHRTHGASGTIEYRAWAGMIARCHNPKHIGYARYGGRGITVCNRWRSYENFVADMGKRPRGGTIERIKNDRGYEPGNCVWATVKQQNNNQSSNRFETYNGERMNLSAWASRLGVPYKTFYQRVARKGIANAIELGGVR